MKIYTEIIKSCSECPEYIWSTEYGDKCRKNYRDIEYNHIIQEWCPLPDKEGDKDGDNNDCKYELNKRCTHADTGDSCSGNCCCYCKYLHQMTCSFYCGIAADLVHGIEDGDNNG